METKKDERKNVAWNYNLNTHKLSGLFPNDLKLVMDLTPLVGGMTEQQELVYQYGIKQWVSSNYAAEKAPADKIKSAEADFAGLVENGIELFGEGKIGLKGRVRANSAPRTLDKAVDAQFTTLTAEQIKSLFAVADAGIAPISKELREKLELRLLELEDETGNN